MEQISPIPVAERGHERGLLTSGLASPNTTTGDKVEKRIGTQLSVMAYMVLGVVVYLWLLPSLLLEPRQKARRIALFNVF